MSMVVNLVHLMWQEAYSKPEQKSRSLRVMPPLPVTRPVYWFFTQFKGNQSWTLLSEGRRMSEAG